MGWGVSKKLEVRGFYHGLRVVSCDTPLSRRLHVAKACAHANKLSEVYCLSLASPVAQWKVSEVVCRFRMPCEFFVAYAGTVTISAGVFFSVSAETVL